MAKELNKRVHINKNAGDVQKNMAIFNHNMGNTISEKKLKEADGDTSLESRFASLVEDEIALAHKEDTTIDWEDYLEELTNAVVKVRLENEEFEELFKDRDEDDVVDDIEPVVSSYLTQYDGWSQDFSDGDFFKLIKFEVPFKATLYGNVHIYAPDKYRAYEMAKDIGIGLEQYANNTFDFYVYDNNNESYDPEMEITYIDDSCDVEFEDYDIEEVEEEDED